MDAQVSREDRMSKATRIENCYIRRRTVPDRSGGKLSFNNIYHYQKIIVALMETHRLMQEIDNISF
jgi:hypothetical protein